MAVTAAGIKVTEIGKARHISGIIPRHQERKPFRHACYPGLVLIRRQLRLLQRKAGVLHIVVVDLPAAGNIPLLQLGDDHLGVLPFLGSVSALPGPPRPSSARYGSGPQAVSASPKHTGSARVGGSAAGPAAPLSARPAPRSRRSSAPFAKNEKPGRAAAFLAALSACFPSAVWSLGIT